MDHRADLWSVGTVLFKLITGKHAFDAEGNVQASLAVMTAEPRKLCSLAPHVPAELEAVVSRCLTKEPAKRWQSAEELAEALRPFGSARLRETRRTSTPNVAGPLPAISVEKASPRAPAEGGRISIVDPSSVPAIRARREEPSRVVLGALAGGAFLLVLATYLVIRAAAGGALRAATPTTHAAPSVVPLDAGRSRP